MPSPASRPSGGPAGAGAGGERRLNGAEERWPKADAMDAQFEPTRRMPSDAVATLWLDELEGLE